MAQPATPKTSTAQRRLCVWAETPEQRREIESRLPQYKRLLMPMFYHGQELADIINAGNPDGIFFYSDNIDLVRVTVRLLEQQCPTCSRFVICSRKNEPAFRAWDGFPPTVLKENESPEAWSDRIERAITVNHWLRRPEFRMVLPRLKTIPSLPESHRRVVEALRNPDFEINDVAELIRQDVALTAQLLKVVNSASLGLAEPVNSIPAAVGLIGAARLQSLVMSAWAFFFAHERMCRGFSPKAEWKHARAVAEAALQLAKQRDAKAALADEAFTAGILHDVGKVMLAANSPGPYADILALAKKQTRPLWQVEKEILGYTHAEVGGCLLGLWGLDLSVVEAVAWHHNPDMVKQDELSALTLVFEANITAHRNEAG